MRRILHGLLAIGLGAIPAYAAPLTHQSPSFFGRGGGGGGSSANLTYFPQLTAVASSDNTYLTFMNPWGTTYSSSQYQQQGSYVRNAFAEELTLYWQYPSPSGANLIASGCNHVCGYDFYSYADYVGHPSSPVTPLQLERVTNFSSTSKVSYSGDLSGYSVIYDTYQTSVPHGTSADRVFELEVFLHCSAAAKSFFAGNSVKRLPDFTDSNGVVWHVVEAQTQFTPSFPDVYFYRADGTDMTSGTFNLLAMMNYAVSKGYGAPYNYVNGTSLGVEPAYGTGQIKYISFSGLLN